jgi:hypothetical protein
MASQPEPLDLNKLKVELDALRTRVDTELHDSPALAFVKQKLQEAASGVSQELRNLRIDAEMAAKKLEAKK